MSTPTEGNISTRVIEPKPQSIELISRESGSTAVSAGTVISISDSSNTQDRSTDNANAGSICKTCNVEPPWPPSRRAMQSVTYEWSIGSVTWPFKVALLAGVLTAWPVLGGAIEDTSEGVEVSIYLERGGGEGVTNPLGCVIKITAGKACTASKAESSWASEAVSRSDTSMFVEPDVRSYLQELSPVEDLLVSKVCEQLREMLPGREFSSRDVITAYIKESTPLEAGDLLRSDTASSLGQPNALRHTSMNAARFRSNGDTPRAPGVTSGDCRVMFCFCCCPGDLSD